MSRHLFRLSCSSCGWLDVYVDQLDHVPSLCQFCSSDLTEPPSTSAIDLLCHDRAPDDTPDGEQVNVSGAPRDDLESRADELILRHGEDGMTPWAEYEE